MSDHDSTRSRKPDSNEGCFPEKEADNDATKSKKKDILPGLYNRFVESFENALNTVTGDSRCTSKSRLSMLNLEGVAEYILTERPCNVIVMTGAGISTSAGIPDFRSPDSGLYDNLQKYDLPDPQAIFEITFFNRKPEPFFTLAKELFPDNLKPTPCHYFIRLLEKKGILRRWFTQNIDGLEYMTGIPEDKVVAAHGSHRSSTCMKCSQKYNLRWITDRLRDPSCIIPKCEKCDGVVKPDIVFFGENLPKRFFQCAISDFPKCDLLIIMGTSLIVQPFAGIVHEVLGNFLM
uniref:Deacetylase sirtuin-type domain-containing protein n=1 Tax=Heterorhabditis bacteriophora TaxID=37862 RepID=A0A1I7XAE0_HETBA